MRRVLVIEDNPDLAFGLRTSLEVEGYDVLQAESGKTGLAADSAQRTDMMDRREGVAASLTPAQIEAAQKRANKFKPEPVVPPDPEDVDWLHE